jgi:cellulose synthase/poly-beta-1,6-N-acetylglucosamine synthase-like glycosyltransferase
MIIELLQFIEFVLHGTPRLLFIFFFINLFFFLCVWLYARRYRPLGHNHPYTGRRNHVVSVVIPTWREEPAWLEVSILSALWAGADEVIICYTKGDRSAEEVVGKFEGRISTIVFKSRVAKKVAVYEAFKRAKGDILCVLDSDTFIEENAINEVCRAFDADPRVGGVVALNNIFNKDHFAGRLSSLIEASRNTLNKALSVLGNVHVLDSRFCAYRRKAVLPLLDEYLNNRFLGRDVVIGEDKQMTYLLQRAGWKCIIQASAVDYTAAPENIAGFLKQQLRWARSGWMYFFRHRASLRLNWLLTFHILLYFLSPIVFPIIVFYDLFLAPPLLLLDVTLLSFVAIVAIIVTGISLITLLRDKIMKLGIRLRDVPTVGLFGLFVLLPLMHYALVTIWKQGSWISR